MKKPKNLLRKIGMIVPGAILGILGLLCVDHSLDRTKHRREYGTRENPAYQIIADYPQVAKYLTYFSTFSVERENSKLTKRIEELTELSTELYPAIFKKAEKLEDSINSLESRLNRGVSQEEQDDVLNKYELISKTFADINNISLSITLDLLNNSMDFIHSDIEKSSQNIHIGIANLAYDHPSEEEKYYKQAINKSKELFKKMTGKDWPSNLEANIEEIEEEKVAGTHNHITGEIKSEKRSYPRTLSILMHESGHAASQQNEQEFYDSLNILTVRHRRGTDIMEEASAYAFQIASAYYDDTDSKERIGENLISLKGFIESYFNGDRETHREAAALAEAAVEYFQCPKKAFNYLATTRYENVDPKIREIIDKAKEQFKSNAVYKSQNDKLARKVEETNKCLDSKLESLNTRISSLEPKLPGPRIDWGEAMKEEK